MLLDHIAIIASSINSLDFYKKLGFEEVKRFERVYDTVVFLKNNSIILEVFIDPKHQKKSDEYETFGLRHISFSVDDFDSVISTLNYEFLTTDWFDRRMCFVKDYDGQIVEIVERRNINDYK